VCLADIFSTVCGAAGVTIPPEAKVDGCDLVAHARGEIPERQSLVARSGSLSGVLENSYKYLYTSNGGGELLFNIEKDPGERCNLLDGEPHIARELRERLIRQLQRERHPDVASGSLRAEKSAPRRRDIRRAPWPGFHSNAEPSDLTH
jgi:arylsulfatase A-like enzyme